MHQELIQETMESMREYLPKLVSASAQIAQDIQSHQGGWLEVFLMYLDGMGWLTDAAAGIQRLDPLALDGWDTASLIDLLGQMKQALEREDFVTLCDLLQYEVQPMLQTYEKHLRRVAN
jgi:hypothetical protein